MPIPLPAEPPFVTLVVLPVDVPPLVAPVVAPPFAAPPTEVASLVLPPFVVLAPPDPTPSAPLGVLGELSEQAIAKIDKPPKTQARRSMDALFAIRLQTLA